MKSLPTRPITFEEFLEWCEPDTRAEWVNGKVVLLSPASSPHQRIVSFLDRTLGVFVAQHGLGQLMVAPFLMKLTTSGREPDLFYFPKGERPRLGHTFFRGPAELAIEVISPESVERDRLEKFGEYEAGGVREYWLIDPEEETAEFYQLGPDLRYTIIPIEDGGIFRSRVIRGYFLRLEWLWQDPSPLPLDVLRELGVLKRD